MKRYVLSALLLMAGAAVAQTPDSLKERDKTLLQNRTLNRVTGDNSVFQARTFDNRYEGQVGTPYLLPGWVTGTVETVSGKNHTNVPLKFDAFRQELLMRRPAGDSIVVVEGQVRQFGLTDANGQRYVFKRLPTLKNVGADLQMGYWLVLHDGPTSLLKRVAKRVKNADFKNTYSTNTRYDAYLDEMAYYVLRPNMTLTKVRLTEKSLLNALPDRVDDLKTLIKQENVAVGTEAGAARVVQAYNETGN